MPDPQTCAMCAATFTPLARGAHKAKYCRHCQLLTRLRERTRRNDAEIACHMCAEPFARIHANDQFCGDCADGPPRPRNPGVCELCHQGTEYLLYPDLPICVRCAFSIDRRAELAQWATRAVRRRRGQPEVAQEPHTATLSPSEPESVQDTAEADDEPEYDLPTWTDATGKVWTAELHGGWITRPEEVYRTAMLARMQEVSGAISVYQFGKKPLTSDVIPELERELAALLREFPNGDPNGTNASKLQIVRDMLNGPPAEPVRTEPAAVWPRVSDEERRRGFEALEMSSGFRRTAPVDEVDEED